MNKIYNIIREDFESEKIKYYILACISIGQSLFTVLTQYFLPEILSANGIPPDLLPEPSALTAIADSFDNFIIIGMILFILTSMSIFSNDRENGVIYYSLSRPIERYEYTIGKMLTKFIVVSVITTSSVFLVIFYSEFIFKQNIDTIDYFSLIVAFILLHSFFISVTSLLSSRISSINSGLISLSIGLVIFAISAMISDIAFLSPFYLAGKYNLMLSGEFNLFNELNAIISIIVLIISTIFLTVLSNQKMEF